MSNSDFAHSEGGVSEAARLLDSGVSSFPELLPGKRCGKWTWPPRTSYLLFQKRRRPRKPGATRADRPRQVRHEKGGGISSTHELTAFVNISQLFPLYAPIEHFTLCQVVDLLTNAPRLHSTKFDDLPTQVLEKNKHQNRAFSIYAF